MAVSPSCNPTPPRDALRLSKVVAAMVPCSRREAEQYIAEGWVRVDGTCVDVPQVRVTAAQRVEIDAQASLQPATPATFLLHKPAGLSDHAPREWLREETHWGGDASTPRRSQAHLAGLKQLLPLPATVSGLSIHSQDFRVVRKLTEDAAFVEQEFIADIGGSLGPEGLALLCHGLVREGRPLPPARVSWQSESRLRFAVKGIAPDAIAWMCAEVGLELRALRRIRIGRVAMAGLPAGQWRVLGGGERF